MDVPKLSPSSDESWIYNFDPDYKQQSTPWMPVGGGLPEEFQCEKSVARQMMAMLMVQLHDTPTT